MKALEALRNGAQLCQSHFSLLWIETAWRSLTLLLCLTFTLLGVFVLLDRFPVGTDLQAMQDTVVLGIFEVVGKVLLKNQKLIFQIILLVLAFSFFVWLLLASFFQGSILYYLAQETTPEDTAHHNGWERAGCFFQNGVQFFSPFLATNLMLLFFSFTGPVAFLLILRSFLRSLLSLGEAPSRVWFLWTYPLALALVCLIVATAQQFLELCKLYVTKYQCSLWSAWNRSAEFFFLNLGSMGAISTFVRMLQLMSGTAAMIFLWQLTLVLGAEFLGLLLVLVLVVFLGYGVLRNYLTLIHSGSLLALIDLGERKG